MGSNIIELVKSGHEQAAELKASCGAVDVRSVAQLISDLASQLDVQLARSNALAAENAGMKKFCKDAAFDADYEAELGMERGGFSDALNEIKTPATDAFLAEVRAQGVEMFGSTTIQFGEEEGDEDIIYAGNQALLFAAQLRREAAQ
ncbi:hypothetical protein DQ807_22295 [Salmonella enterica subsp. enterica serovar Weltevreden]|nr:hypothetical protein [Salmonella enterica subsp. enterica serovar Weltevreden]EDU5871947.1 hypothetical protein [Salmonella enterica subsp. enterica]EEB0665251.1 hypothetical protein [Salmonella enterica subsp. enterica serovar Binza]EJN9365494.1 hypothetical protein [Salmonella enterica]ELF2129806.1 hypothetical protein [Salmonella enterica]